MPGLTHVYHQPYCTL